MLHYYPPFRGLDSGKLNATCTQTRTRTPKFIAPSARGSLRDTRELCGSVGAARERERKGEATGERMYCEETMHQR